MLASGVLVGVIAGIAFGGDWRRLSTFSLRLWPILVAAIGLRVVGVLVPNTPLPLYIASLSGVAFVASWNWRIPGASLIAFGTGLNIVVAVLNGGMPYDPVALAVAGAPVPNDGLHIPLTRATQLEFLADVIPVPLVRSVYSLGDFIGALGGFLIPFMWLQPPARAAQDANVRSPNFAFFWMGQAISRFGDPITLVALTYVTYRITQSALLTALAVVITTLPSALFGFFGGAVADAVGHRRAMLGCDIVRAVVLALVPLLLALDAPLVSVFIAVFLTGLCAAVFNPARVALIPTLLDRANLARGNSLVYATDRAVEIVGGLAGGFLVATIGVNAFYADSLTFALSAMLLSRVVLHGETRRPVTWEQLLADTRQGLEILRRSAVLWSNTIFSLAAQFSTPVINGLTPVLIIRRFADDDPVAGAALYGVSEAAIAVGAVVGSAFLPRYSKMVAKGRLLVMGFAATGATVMLIGLAPSFTVALPLFLVLGFANVIFYVPNVTILQEHTEASTRGRVFGARIGLLNLSWLPLIVVSGALAEAVGPGLLIGIAGAITLAVALAGSRIPAVYRVA